MKRTATFFEVSIGAIIIIPSPIILGGLMGLVQCTGVLNEDFELEFYYP